MALRTAIGKAALRLARWCGVATYSGAPTDEINYGQVGLRDAIRSGWYRNETRELFAGFPIMPPDTVADIGCGGGGNALFCAKFAAHLIAVDINPDAVASLDKRLRAESAATYRIAVSDGNPLPIESESVDKVICTEVLEHVDDVKQFFGELARIGKRGALYLLSAPDPLSEKILMRVSPPSSYAKPNHIRVIGRDEFEHLANEAGLVVQKHVYYGFYWSVWNALVWQTDADFDRGRDPVLDHWARTWNGVLDLPKGDVCKAALDDNLPKSQVIIAYKI